MGWWGCAKMAPRLTMRPSVRPALTGYNFVRDKYHCEPQIAWFDSPVVVDNERGEIRAD